MLEKVIMPTLGLGMEEAVILQWLKKEGETVAKDEPLLTVETDKATTEINAPATGVLRQIAFPDGSAVPVTKTIAFIETDAEAGATAEAPEEAEGTGGHADVLAAPPTSSASTAADWAEPRNDVKKEGTVRASPAARRVARDFGINLEEVKGTGPGGRIQGEDVRRHANQWTELGEESKTPNLEQGSREQGGIPRTTAVVSGLPGRLIPLGRKRRVTAQRMSLSASTVARLTLHSEVDAGELIALRTRLQPAYQEQGTRLTFDAMMAKVVAEALSSHPEMNTRWTDGGIYFVEPINVGVAMAVEDGLVVPVVKDANRKRLLDVAKELGQLQEKAKADRLTADDMTGGTFTITNLGMFGVDSFTPIVNPPECAILGVGRMVERPVGRRGQLVLRPTMVLSLSFDHRIVDGAPAGRFLQRIARLIEEPYLLL